MIKNDIKVTKNEYKLLKMVKITAKTTGEHSKIPCYIAKIAVGL